MGGLSFVGLYAASEVAAADTGFRITADGFVRIPIPDDCNLFLGRKINHFSHRCFIKRLHLGISFSNQAE